MAYFETPYLPPGYTSAQATAAANAYAQQRGGYSPHMVVQEGTVSYHGSTPGYYVKYNTPQGSSTEWTPLTNNGQPYPPGAGPSGPSGGGATYGGFDDPAVAAARNLAAQIRSNAQASALARREQAALQYGSAEGLQSLIGNDYANIAQQAAANPYSTLANLKYGYDTGLNAPGGLEDQLNKANLFYSGYRGTALADAAHQYQQQQYNAAQNYQGLLTDIADQLAQNLMNAQELEMQAYLNSSGGGYDYSQQQAAAPYTGAPVNDPRFKPPGGSQPVIYQQAQYPVRTPRGPGATRIAGSRIGGI